MIPFVILFPLLSFAIAAIPRRRAWRIAMRSLFAIGAVLATIALLPHVDTLSGIFASLVSVVMALVVFFSSGLFPEPAKGHQAPWSRPSAFFPLDIALREH